MKRILPPIALLAGAVACAGAPAGETPLVRAARTGDVAAIRALAAKGEDLNALAGGNGWTPLLHAIHKGRGDAVQALIAAGADVNRKSPGNVSPLEMAAANGQIDNVRRLLAAGADPHEPGVFTAAVSGGALSDIEQPLLGRCHPEIVDALLHKAPDLRLPRNGVGHLSYWVARWNSCERVLQTVRFRS